MVGNFPHGKAVGQSQPVNSKLGRRNSTAAPPHDETCGLDIAGQRPMCPGCAAMKVNAGLIWPGRDEPMPGDLELVKKLALPRVPHTLDQAERATLLVQLLDLERTLCRYPGWANDIRAILQGIFGR